MLDSLPPAKRPKEPSEASVDYCRAIWRAVCERAGRDPERTSSSLDFGLMYGWWQSRIPLRVVLRGIQDTPKNGTTVAYYRPSVEEAYRYFRKCYAATRPEDVPF